VTGQPTSVTGQPTSVTGQPTSVTGQPTVDLIGGEPTVHPHLVDLVRHSRDRGFEHVFVCTNGRALARPRYLDRLVEAGLTGVRFSFHHHDPRMAGMLAGVPAAGPAYLAAARTLLARADLYSVFYRLILSRSLDSLEAYVEWLARRNRTGHPLRLVLGMPSMRGRLHQTPSLIPPLRGLRRTVRSAITRAKALGVEPLLMHAPACLYPEEPERAACTYTVNLQVDGTGHQRVMNYEGDARFGRACDRCAARDLGCHGLPSAYFALDAPAAEAWLTPLAPAEAPEA
jgi:hypothetical protein